MSLWISKSFASFQHKCTAFWCVCLRTFDTRSLLQNTGYIFTSSFIHCRYKSTATDRSILQENHEPQTAQDTSFREAITLKLATQFKMHTVPVTEIVDDLQMTARTQRANGPEICLN
jgi:hypothetical protein